MCRRLLLLGRQVVEARLIFERTLLLGQRQIAMRLHPAREMLLRLVGVVGTDQCLMRVRRCEVGTNRLRLHGPLLVLGKPSASRLLRGCRGPARRSNRTGSPRAPPQDQPAAAEPDAVPSVDAPQGGTADAPPERRPQSATRPPATVPPTTETGASLESAGLCGWGSSSRTAWQGWTR